MVKLSSGSRSWISKSVNNNNNNNEGKPGGWSGKRWWGGEGREGRGIVRK
jgi:hypothetical protein